MDTALRELREETGITADMINVIPGFRFEERYQAKYKRFGGETVEKTLVRRGHQFSFSKLCCTSYFSVFA